MLAPLPGAAWVASVLGATVGGFALSRRGGVAWLQGVAGSAGGCVTGAIIDVLAIFGLASLIALGDFASVVPS